MSEERKTKVGLVVKCYKDEVGREKRYKRINIVLEVFDEEKPIYSTYLLPFMLNEFLGATKMCDDTETNLGSLVGRSVRYCSQLNKRGYTENKIIEVLPKRGQPEPIAEVQAKRKPQIVGERNTQEKFTF